MTRPGRSSLVLDGSEVKLRLQAQRTATKTPVHVDWVRFTCYLRNVETPSAERLFPSRLDNVWDDKTRSQRLTELLQEVSGPEFQPSAQALELAEKVCQALGPDFTVAVERRKGHDFYRYRWSIERQGSEVGWVGYMASGDSPRQQAQSRTVHCNLFGAACTFAEPGWNHRIADLVDAADGDLTRCDLALDFFDGIDGGIEGIRQNYMDGLCDVAGKRLKCNMVGDWCNGHERSFYFGSKEAGKQTNAYEKGDQLFGREALSPWLRVELRYGNKLRQLSTEMLRRPADFFAGASDWHSLILSKADAHATPEPIRCNGRLALQTIEAEVVRNIRWAKSTAAATFAAAVQFLGVDELADLFCAEKLPARLQRFKPSELAQVYARAAGRVSTSEGHRPAFA